MAFPVPLRAPLRRAALALLWAFGMAVVAAGAPALAQAPAGTPLAAASVHAAPGLTCKLHSASGAASAGIPVYSASDGYVRFYALKAKAGDAAARYTLDCVDEAGKASAYPVDLSSDDAFVARPLDLSKEPGTDRPALKGDPSSYTDEQLIQGGYGPRPDRATEPDAYARWLEAAQLPGRILAARHPDPHTHGVTATPGEGGGAFWVGSVLTGAPSYVAVEATFNVPQYIAGGDQTNQTYVSIWDGVGGYGQNGLIQAGVDMYTTSPTVGAYGTFREYAGGDPDNNTHNGVPYGGNFTPNAGDKIYSVSWYCDSKGNKNINGGYGCTHMQDETSGAVFDCTSPNGSPCWSVKALPLCSVQPSNKLCFTLGLSAEFVMENEDGDTVPFTDFSPKITMSGSAYSSTTNKYSQKISNDPTITVLTDGTNLSTRMLISLGTTDQTYFEVEPGQPTYGFYCQGPLKTSDASPPLTRFIWASQGAGAQAPGPGQCAWPDRGPRGTEIKAGNSNEIRGYLNAETTLPSGKFMELGVFNDPAHDNEVVQPPKLVNPPFSANPAAP